MAEADGTSLPALPLQITPGERAIFSAYLSSHHQLSHYEPFLALGSEISSSSLNAAVSLVALTSSAAYAASSKGWSARAKRKEMLEEGMRFIMLRPPKSTASTTITDNAAPADHGPAIAETATGHKVKAQEEEIAAFLSYLPVHETDPDAHPKPHTFSALYIYEIHVHPSHQGAQLGTRLMHLAHQLAAALAVQKTMLTVFYSNGAARRLYDRFGYVFWDEEFVPIVRKSLRGGVKDVGRSPGYVILARDVGGGVVGDGVGGMERDGGGGEV